MNTVIRGASAAWRLAWVSTIAAALLVACDRGPVDVAPPPGPNPAPASAQLVLIVEGLPEPSATPETTAALVAAGFGLRVQGPDGFDTLVVRTITLAARPPGDYLITAGSAEYAAVRYAATSDTQRVTLTSGTTHTVNATFVATTGGVELRVSGAVPDSLHYHAALQYPDGRIETVALPTARTLLLPGTYVVAPMATPSGGVLYAPDRPSDTIVVAPGPIAGPTWLSYTARRASLQLAIDGVPLASRRGTVEITDADGARRIAQLLGDTVRFHDLSGGVYTIVAPVITDDTARYVPVYAVDTVSFAAGATATHTLAYASETASLALSLSGLPASLAGDVQVSGPFGFSRTVRTDTVLTALRPGSYTMVANPVDDALHSWKAEVTSQVASITFGEPVSRHVQYAIASGGLVINISGMPETVAPHVTVRAATSTSVPNFPWELTGSSSRTNVSPGVYTVNVTPVAVGDALYVATPAQRTISVVPSVTPITVDIEYIATFGPRLDFAIDGAYLTQAAQRLDGTVPLVAGRDALLRVFARANEGNQEALTVRVRLFHADTLYRTLLIPSPTASAPLAASEGDLTRSWNVLLDGADVREGMSFIADFGAAPGVSDANLSNNRWPAAGAFTVDVREVSPFALVFIPIAHAEDGRTGNVTPANVELFANLARRVLPVRDFAVSVRTPFVTAAPTLLPDDKNLGWARVLNEINTLHIVEKADKAYYMGIVSTNYASGIAGMAHIGGRQSLSWDLPLTAPRVVAHELGHNLGRFHSPGCGAGFADKSYPHSAGAIGVWGWTGSGLASPVSTNDIMGYCTSQWVSDYTWTGMLNFRAIVDPVSAPYVAGVRTSARQRAGNVRRMARATAVNDTMLIVWGTITADGAILEPAFRTITAPSLPPVGSGRYTLDVLDATNRVLFTVRFDGEVLDHNASVQSFSVAIPVSAWRSDAALLRLRRGAAVIAEQRSRGGAVSPTSRLARVSGTRAELQWHAAEWPLAVVRDRASGEVLAFARAGSARLPVAAGRELDVILSDGVRSRVQRLRVP